MKLTARTVAALGLSTGKADAIHFDETMPGFGFRLRRGAGGKLLRSWVVQFRHGGTSRRLLLGSAEVLGAEQARIMAKKALGKVANGEDPAADRADRRGRDRVSVRSMVDQYLKQAEVRPHTMAELRRYLTGNYWKPLHSMAIDSVSRRDVAARLVVVQNEHGSIVARAARGKLGGFFTWAMTQGVIENNPIIGTAEPKGGKPRERTLSDAELAAVWHACQDDDFGKIVRLLILLGARRREVGGLAFGELVLEGPQPSWTLPASRSKNGRSHTLPLLGLARGIIESVPQRASRDFLFGERSSSGFSNWPRYKAALDERSGVTEPWVLHDCRRTFSTRLHDLGAPPHIIEEILNHQSGHRAGPAGVYNRSRYPNEVRAALALWEDHVRTLVEGGERKVLALHATIKL